MYLCSWLTNNTQCTNTTSYLVCSKCLAEKDELYNKYKQKEKTVLSALSSAPRGNILEVSKVLGRLSQVIELRQQFTSHLSPQVRDNGHKYHISKLLQVMLDYKQYLNELNNEHIEDVEIEEPTVNIVTQQQVLSAQITKVVEEDPFAQYDDVIKHYKNEQLIIDNYLTELANKYNINNDNARLVVSFMCEIGWWTYESPKLITHIVQGRAIVKKFAYDSHSITVKSINLISQSKGTTTDEDISWVLQYGNKCEFALVPYQNQMILICYSGPHVFRYTYRICISNPTNNEVRVRLLPVTIDCEDILSTLSKSPRTGCRQKYLNKYY